MKKIFKFTGIFFLIIFLIAGAAIAAVFIIVDKPFIEEQMEKALSRNVSIESIDINVFSIVSGIEVSGISISNYINPEKLKDSKDKPVEKNNIFVSLDSFKFKLQFLPLIKRQFVLKEITLYSPVINVIRFENGSFNFSDLLAADKSKSTEPGKKEEKPAEVKEPSKPITADQIPIEINIGKIGIEKGKVSFTDKKLNQTLEVYDLTFLLHSIQLDSKNLESKNSVKIKFTTNIKTVGKIKSGSIQTFDFNLSADAVVKPFDVKTRILNPEISANAGSKKGTVTGLQVFEALKNVEQLEKYCGKLSFLKDSINWTDLKTSVWYKDGIVKTQDGLIKTEDYNLKFAGQSNVNSQKLEYDVEMILADKNASVIKKNLEQNIETGINALKVDKYVKAADVIEPAMKAMLNKDGEIYFIYKITGTYVKPNPELIEPKFPSISKLIKDALANASDAVKAEIEKQIKKEADAAKKKAEAEAKKAEDSAKKEATSKIKTLIKK